MNLKGYKRVQYCIKYINYLLIPVNNINIDEGGKEEFNKLYNFVLSLNLPKTLRTPSGGISNDKNKQPYQSYDITRTNYCVELLLLYEGWAYRFQFRNTLHRDISGRKAFTKFRRELAKDGVNIDDFAIENGKEVKETIEKPLIALMLPTYADKVFENCYHIDFHSSYPAGLIKACPQMEKTIRRLYINRHKNEDYKAILNLSIGFMQSIKGCGARWSHLSKVAIEDNNTRVIDMAKRLSTSGRRVILFNTDGIWYQGNIYHGVGEGNNVGEWSNDYKAIKFRAKSEGCYEFIDSDGKYHPVVRGIKNEDKVSWKWGDIYSSKAEAQIYYFDESKGVY